METFDAPSFFSLHDMDHNNQWYDSTHRFGVDKLICRTLSEVRLMYGLHDPEIPSSRADEIVQSVFTLFNKGIDDTILKEEFVALLESGGDLPDCEFDGHHGDEEWEVPL